MVAQTDKIVEIDGHVHTMVGCHPLGRDRVVSFPRMEGFLRKAIERRCSFVISDHDKIDSFLKVRQVLKRMSIEPLRDLDRIIEIAEDVYVISGEEISTRSGHLLAWGVSEIVIHRKPFEDTINAIHDQGGLAIAPHPLLPFGVDEKRLMHHGALLDGLELTANNGFNKKAPIRRIARELALPLYGGSDAHDRNSLGRARSSFPAVLFRKDTDQQILDALRKTQPLGSSVEPYSIFEWIASRLDKHSHELMLTLGFSKRE